MEQGIYLPGKEHDYFYPYLKTMAKESALAGSVPVEDMDALLNAASDDIMAYTILTLMYRAGMTSTEIIGISEKEISQNTMTEFMQCFPEERSHAIYLMMHGQF